ncbi:MAG TPA: glycosyl hydrolase family 18 protein, partial [Candidatus Saccharimonadales bacterium]|nr:glycosyl hydrolase family 18 protein [Candidatus Saccharimonadales bacterium]
MLSHRSTAAPNPGRRLVAILGLLLVSGLLPAAVAAAQPHEVGLEPTVHFEDAQKHADDRIAFKPGARVSVPFKPRKTDRWKVDGKAARSLPAGRMTGRAMRDLRNDGLGATDAVEAGIDQPQVDPSTTAYATTAALVGSDDTSVDLTASVSSGGLRREVFGFLPYWELSDSSTTLDWAKISTLAYFGVGADGKGNLQKKNSNGSTTVGWSGWTSSRMTSVINAAHKSGARVVLTVQSFAWSSTGLERQKALLGSSTARANLATQIARAVRDRGADGVNLDFEPLASGYGDEFTALVRKVRSTLSATAPGYQLTFDTLGWIGNYPIEKATASGGADAIVIMGYDYRSATSGVAGSIAPMRSS